MKEICVIYTADMLNSKKVDEAFEEEYLAVSSEFKTLLVDPDFTRLKKDSTCNRSS